MKKIKVLVVDDSAFMRKVVSDIINACDHIEVIATAKNGKEALELLKTLKPDVVTMDIEMPVMDGLTALEKAMDTTPVPIVMLSSLTKEGADATLKALELGAVDFITKPSSVFKINADDVKTQLIEKLEIASRIRIPKKRKQVSTDVIRPKTSRFVGHNDIRKIIAIGTSTGGPKALQSVIPLIPKNIDAPVLIVQHMPPGFTKSLAERLDSMSAISVKEAEDGDMLQPGWCYVAPGDKHLRVVRDVKGFRIALGSDGPVTGHRPSADAMFDSLAQLDLHNIVGVIMTGMGADGAKGLVNIKKNRNFVIAQDEDSCVVFGMPKSAIKLDAVDKIVSLENITDEIIKAMEV
ncbi:MULTISPECIES: chemotaxis response regulator protein-glutamate methylesterase [unclassified Fusibacter]|uniref:protein-glutamate methylesterase/protein-glutamine glutaminase n=1 Tax=unclassified Fusibacter TaxID=2624464 RepID=UPI001010376F|nr:MULTISPECIES: chemotaxis response regulator protein-glutamate methylesterase [unclassified Fusibacter]MCK8058780.1 chemotaxis response regulator protein-glutamate methylesterase [Fusibacter sp. A2]NPE21854.1 chemotaxis response regulator protein-glutamate methylesterase [Fusibacter sp. A1]RXV61426.1 chemotaxis response regulator protein-glutamate methylesterase [Fusibacter sp. A1]